MSHIEIYWSIFFALLSLGGFLVIYFGMFRSSFNLGFIGLLIIVVCLFMLGMAKGSSVITKVNYYKPTKEISRNYGYTIVYTAFPIDSNNIKILASEDRKINQLELSSICAVEEVLVNWYNDTSYTHTLGECK